MKRTKLFFIHFILWSIIISTHAMGVDAYYYAKGGSSLLQYTLHAAFGWGTNICFFYIVYGLLYPSYLVTRKYISFGVLLVLFATINFFLHSFAWNGFDPAYLYSYRDDNLSPLLEYPVVMTFVSIGLRIWEDWSQSAFVKKQLTKEFNLSELNFLKSQMSPHFLFNTLNNIYGLSITNDEKTSYALLQLHKLIDYINEFEKKPLIPLHYEVDFLKSYISLHQLRFGTQISCQFQFQHPDKSIEPMLLLPFIENAFKHGKTSPSDKIIIELTENQDKLHFYVSNAVAPNKRKDQTSGVGIKNVQRRVDLLYPNRHHLKLKSTYDHFELHLTLY